MSRTARIEKQLRTLATMERAYEVMLRDALESCAAGYWGLFGQNDASFEAAGYARFISTDAKELIALGTSIADLRTKLVLEEFPLHARFLAYRAMRGSNVPGEPRLASTFLHELNSRAEIDEPTLARE